ncbi:hypothetical protein ACWG0P_13910 [Amedibacillus sp. YH-ame6]
MKRYKLSSIKNNFIFCDNSSLDCVLAYAENMSICSGKSIMGTLNNLQAELNVGEEHHKTDFPLMLINLVLKEYGLKIMFL